MMQSNYNSEWITDSQLASATTGTGYRYRVYSFSLEPVVTGTL